MRLILLASLGLAGLGLTGCSSAVATATADGRPAYEFRCGGLLDSKMDCNINASRMCPLGYNPVESGPGRLVAVCATRPQSRAPVAPPPKA